MIKLKATSDVRTAVEYFPPIKAKDFKPAWYSKMPLYETKKSFIGKLKSVLAKVATVKSCVGISNVLNSGIIVRQAFDMSIIIYPDGTYTVETANAMNLTPVTQHAPEQHPNLWNNHVVLKLQSPWAFEEKTGVNFVMVPPVYHLKTPNKFFIPHGILDFKYNNSVNVFMVLPIQKEPYEVFIKAGDPLSHLIPLSKEDVSITVEHGNTEEIIEKRQCFLVSSYRRKKKLIDGD